MFLQITWSSFEKHFVLHWWCLTFAESRFDYRAVAAVISL